MIRNFDPKRDVGLVLIDPAKSKVWRFLDFGRAKAKFGELSALPWCLADEQKRQELREKQKQRILAAGLPFPKKLKALDGVKSNHEEQKMATSRFYKAVQSRRQVDTGSDVERGL